jgi:asparagine synthetase A
MAAKIDEAVILVCIGQALQEAEYHVARANRGAADWWSNKADEYTAHPIEVRAFYARRTERAQRSRAG